MTIGGNVGRPIGLPKTGGRKTGTPNRATITLMEQLKEIGCNPLIELAKMGMNDKLPPEVRMRCLAEVAIYVYPKRKPIDTSSDEPTVININTELDLSGSDGGSQPDPEA